MRTVFADSYYFFAMSNPKDSAHQWAVAFGDSFTGTLVTSAWVLTELGDGLTAPNKRLGFLRLATQFRNSADVQYVPSSEERLSRGIALYSSRPDKNWSLTDCTSFTHMQELGIVEALTGDHHFEQAGFVALLK